MATRVTMNSSDDDIETALVAGRAMLKALRKLSRLALPHAELHSALEDACGEALAAVEHGQKAGLR